MALWRVRAGGGERLARGGIDAPAELLDPGLTVDALLSAAPGALAEALAGPGEPLGGRPVEVLVPIAGQDVWAAGVTFERSRQARKEESGGVDFYDRVYEAERPELFPKAAPGRARGPGELVGVRADSGWDVPEPELAVVADAGGEIVALTIGNDVSSRSIEGENPLYLPQAKVYRGSCALGPCLVPVAEAPPLDELEITLEIARGGRRLFADAVPVANMRRKPAELVEWLFRAQDFPLGVVLLCGTSIVPGPELTLQAGDLVTIAVTGLGSLTNTVEVVGGR